MKEHTINRDNDRDLVFTGELVASASSSANNASSSYSGSVGRWTELRLYRTKGGKYVCQSIGRTQHQGEHNRHTAAVCETDEAVCEFFGSSWLAKELYENAGIDCAERVD
ncbi:MAG: hypothetical protein ACSLEZ_13070 [Thiobacillus sp.]